VIVINGGKENYALYGFELHAESGSPADTHVNPMEYVDIMLDMYHGSI
jgi:hypothetical protein